MPVCGSKVALPYVGAVPTVRVSGSESASEALIRTATTPFVPGWATCAVAVGSVLSGEIVTVTGTVVLNPNPSSTVIWKVSTPPLRAAWWRAAAVGV